MQRHISLFLRHIVLLNIAILFCQQNLAQYYYHDIVLTNQNQRQQQLYKKNKVTLVKVLSFEANGMPAEHFVCELTPNNSYTQIKTFTQTDLSGKSSLTSYYNFKGQLYRSVDSSNESATKYDYSYDSTGRLSLASNISEGFTSKVQQKEAHDWKYSTDGCPQIMYRVKNGTDTTHVKLLCDEAMNVIEEESFWQNISKEKIYYYYDNLNRLTDIVRYNPRLGKLLPDYMFEYNNAAQLTQMITVQQGGSDYLTWRYEYAENGLKTRELCFDKQKRLVGRIEYQYSFKNQ